MTDLSVDLSVEASSQAWTPALLSPTLWFDASSLTSASTTWTNQGTGGSVLNGTFGATTAAPRVLTHTGTNYLYLPGVNGNYASTPASAAFTPTSDVEVVVRVSLAAFNVQQEFFGNSAGLATGGFEFFINATGFLTFRWSDGTTERNSAAAQSVTAAGLVAGTTYWFKVTFDVDNGASGSQGRFYWAADQSSEPASWNQFTAPAAGVGTTVIAASANQAGIGAYYNGGANPMTGAMYRCIVRNGIGGTVVFDADFTTGITSGGQTGIFDSSSNNAAITINRSASGYKATAVVRPTLLFGGGQHIQVADNALVNFGFNDPYSIVVVTRSWPTISTNQRIVAKNDVGTGALWRFYIDATSKMPMFSTSDGTTASGSFAGTVAQGASRLSVVGVTHTGTSPVYQQFGNVTFAGTVGDTATGGLSNSSPMIIGGTSPTPSTWFEGEILAVLLIRRVLTAAEIQQVSDYYTYEDALAYTVGTLTTVSGYNILTFNGSGTFTPGRNLPVEYLVVAGGGGGGGTTGAGNGAGGGGAGGLLTNVGATKLVLPKAQQTITIGAGGAGTTTSGTNGSASSIGSLLVANGGGRGGGWTLTGLSGGSGGGSGPVASPNPTVAAGSGTAGQGFDGGAGNSGTGSFRHGGGGGGAGGAGGAGASSVGGAGGASVNNAISGTVTAYAGGGGGGGVVAGGAAGGGGSTAGTVGVSATAATANTGGGGGGTGSNTATAYTGGAGGSGIVIIRWPA